MKKHANPQTPGMQKHATSLRIVMMIFAAALILAIAGTGFFVYTNVYSTIGDVRSLIILSENFGFEIIDFKRLDRVQSQWDIKHSTSTATIVRDPFHDVPREIATTTPE